MQGSIISTKFEPNWFINSQVHANIKFFDVVSKTAIISTVSSSLTQK